MLLRLAVSDAITATEAAAAQDSVRLAALAVVHGAVQKATRETSSASLARLLDEAPADCAVEVAAVEVFAGAGACKLNKNLLGEVDGWCWTLDVRMMMILGGCVSYEKSEGERKDASFWDRFKTGGFLLRSSSNAGREHQLVVS